MSITPIDRKTRDYQRLCARAERAGYDGDIADLFDDQPDDYDRLEPAALVYATGALLFVAIIVGLVLLPAVQR